MTDLTQVHFEHNDNIIRSSQWEKLAIDDLDPIVKTNYGYKINFVFWQRKISKSQILSTLVKLVRDCKGQEPVEGDLNELIYTAWSTKASVLTLYNELGRNKKNKIDEAVKDAKLSGITPSMTKFSAYYHADNNHLIINSTARVSELACFIIGKVVTPAGLVSSASAEQLRLVELQDNFDKSYSSKIEHLVKADIDDQESGLKACSNVEYWIAGSGYDYLACNEMLLIDYSNNKKAIIKSKELPHDDILINYINNYHVIKKLGFKALFLSTGSKFEASFNFDFENFCVSQFRLQLDASCEHGDIESLEHELNAVNVISDFCNTIINQFNSIVG